VAGQWCAMSLAGKVVVVTGGSRGIGRACVLHAVARGARVVFCSRRNGTDSREVEAAAAVHGGAHAALGIAADVADERGVVELFDVAYRQYGAVHGVVSNAAVSRAQLLVSMGTEDWDAVIDTNLSGGFLVVRTALRHFLARGRGGRIVSIGTLSQHGISGNASYAVSKGGIAGLTRRITREYAHAGIVAAMVIPGYVETAMSASMTAEDRRRLIDGCPLRRSGSPGEIASVVTFLLADTTVGFGGQTVRAAGGLWEVPP
jgi:NAD(P)-dependent dehydrogenase (short-subunit alcohol dehydrogenase family)